MLNVLGAEAEDRGDYEAAFDEVFKVYEEARDKARDLVDMRENPPLTDPPDKLAPFNN